MLVQSDIEAAVNHDLADFLARLPRTYAVHDSNSRPVACYGIRPIWDGRGEAWALFDRYLARDHMLTIVRDMRFMLHSAKEFRRIEATVEADYEEGHRLMRAVGFEIENEPGLLRNYGVNGEDHVLYTWTHV